MGRKVIILPESFLQNLAKYFAPHGDGWLQALPDLLAECEARWSMTIHPPFPNLSINYVAPATLADGTLAVFKAGVPGTRELLSEMEALRLCDGVGMARLLRADPERGVMLLERVQPGTPLREAVADDDAATRIVAQTMQQIWRPLPADHGLIPVESYAGGLTELRTEFDGSTGPLPVRLVEIAERLFADLFASLGQRVLVHGDFHHDNILRHKNGWRVIDPKGLAGEAEYEVGVLFYNPIGINTRPDLEQIQARRLAILHEILGFDRQRMIAWGVAQCVLSAWWDVDDNGRGGEGALRCAESLLPLLKVD